MDTITLSDGSTREVPEGCDIAAFRRAQEKRLRNAQNRKPAKPKPRRKNTRTHKANKRTFRADSVLATATLELINQVNQVKENKQ